MAGRRFTRREETAGTIDIVGGKARKTIQGTDPFTLRVKVNIDTQPVAVALIEAKREGLPPTHGLEQAKVYAACKRLNVPFVFSSNGHLFVEYDHFTGITCQPRPLSEFPTPSDLRARYEQGMGFSLGCSAARPLLMRTPAAKARGDIIRTPPSEQCWRRLSAAKSLAKQGAASGISHRCW